MSNRNLFIFVHLLFQFLNGSRRFKLKFSCPPSCKFYKDLHDILFRGYKILHDSARPTLLVQVYALGSLTLAIAYINRKLALFFHKIKCQSCCVADVVVGNSFFILKFFVFKHEAHLIDCKTIMTLLVKDFCLQFLNGITRLDNIDKCIIHDILNLDLHRILFLLITLLRFQMIRTL